MTNVFSMDIVTIEQSYSVLQKPAATVTFPLSSDDKMLIEAMRVKLTQLEGVGLAAPQVNQSRQIIAIYIPESAALLRDDAKPYPLHFLFNPSYTPINNESKTRDFEACYSVSGKAGKVPRYQQISLTYTDEEGNKHQSIEEGFYARVLQHEIDHINGVLIIDRLTSDCVQGSLEEMMFLRRAELSKHKQNLFDELMKKKFAKTQEKT